MRRCCGLGQSGPWSGPGWSAASNHGAGTGNQRSRANRGRINRSNPVRARDLLGICQTVLFAPEDLALVKGDPSNRRRFLDELLVSLVPRHAATRSDYDRVLKQRNALLKSARAGKFTRGP